ncbi:MAG: hypothetical protein OCD01_02265 [Fibrobacterales bacterium]
MNIPLLLIAFICFSSVLYAQEKSSYLLTHRSTPRSMAHGDAGITTQGSANTFIQNAALSLDELTTGSQLSATYASVGHDYTQKALVYRFPLFKKELAVGILYQHYENMRNTTGALLNSLEESQYSLNMAFAYSSSVQFGVTIHSGELTSTFSRAVWQPNAQLDTNTNSAKHEYIRLDVGALYRKNLIPDRVELVTGVVINDLYYRMTVPSSSSMGSIFQTENGAPSVLNSFFKEIGAGISLQGDLGMWLSGDITINLLTYLELGNNTDNKGTGDSRYTEESKGSTIHSRLGIRATVLSILEGSVGPNSYGWGVTLNSDTISELYRRITQNRSLLHPITHSETTSQWSVLLRYFNAQKVVEEVYVAMDEDGRVSNKEYQNTIKGYQLDVLVGYRF